MITNNQSQFLHPATGFLHELLSVICQFHEGSRLVESDGPICVITYSCHAADGGRVIGRQGWVIKALSTLTQAIGKAQAYPAKFELVNPPNKESTPAKTPPFNRDYDTTKVRELVADALGLIIDGHCMIDEVRTVASITITIQPFRHLDKPVVEALNTVAHAYAMAEGYPKLNVVAV